MSEKDILNKIVKGAGFTAAGMFFSKFITYFYRLTVARIGPDAYGQLALGLTVVGLLGTLSKFGFDEAIKKFVPEAREKNDKSMLKGIVLDSIKFITLTSLFLGIITFLSAEVIANLAFDSPETAKIIKIFAFVPFFSKIASIFLDVTLGFNTTKYKVITVQIFQNLVQLGTTLVLVFMSFGVAGAAFGWLIGIITTVPVSLYFMEKNFGPIIFSKVEPKKMYPKMLKFSYPLILSGIVGTALGWGDTALLGYFMDDATVGFYNAAYPTAMLITIPMQAMSSLALPSFSELGAKGNGKEDTLKTTTRWVFSMAFPAFLLMALFPSELLHLLFGSEYSTAGTALTILAFGTVIGSSTGQLGAYLKSDQKTKIIFLNTSINLILNLILNIALIPILGMVGAAIATASSTIFINLIMLAEVFRIRKEDPFSLQMLKAVPSGVIALGITYFFFKQVFSPAPYWILIPGGVTFGTVYSIVFLKIGGLTDLDKEIIITAARKIGFEEKVKRILQLTT